MKSSLICFTNVVLIATNHELSFARSCCDWPCLNSILNVYPRKAFDGTADGSAVTRYHRSVHQGLSKLRHTGHVHLLVRNLLPHLVCGAV